MPFYKNHIPWNKGETNVYTQKTLDKMSSIRIGIKLSEETKERISESKKGKTILTKGKHLSDEHKMNLSKSHKGKIPWNKGIPMSEEQKQKMIGVNKGNNYRLGKPHTNETKFKISESQKGKHPSIETIKKIRESMKGKNKGEKSNFWKGGITPLRFQIISNFKYRQWRSDIFYRDDFTCQECGIKGDRLNAHHIKSFSSIMQFYEITTLEEALECEELWNINNGITLCKECHKEIHLGMVINA